VRGQVFRALGFAGLAAIGALACGGDDTSPQNACEQVVDAYARSWERCGRDTYENAYDVWSAAFPCDSVKNVKQSQIDDCVTDVTNQDCGAVANGTAFASCNALFQ